jgi:hypothetical protein
MWDPSTWVFPEHEFRIYADDRAQIYAVVDEADYHWAIQWRWSWKPSRRFGDTKFYLRRAVGENQSGFRLRTYTLYLHIEIQKRTGVLPPSPAHKLVDHRNGLSLNCRRENLRWATHSMNSLNRFGSHPHDLVEG